jgi:hypothetical protein
MMKDLATKAVVTGPDGFYYREEHEWHNISPIMSDVFTKQEKVALAYIARASSNKQDDGLVATLDSTKDGVVQPTVHVAGISREELSNFQDLMQRFGADVIAMGREHGRKKDGEHRRKHGR